jgi:hypothetical protein
MSDAFLDGLLGMARDWLPGASLSAGLDERGEPYVAHPSGLRFAKILTATGAWTWIGGMDGRVTTGGTIADVLSSLPAELTELLYLEVGKAAVRAAAPLVEG